MTTKDFIKELEKGLHYCNEEGIPLYRLRAIIHNVKEMDAALTTAREALEFYAKKDSWSVCADGVIVDFYDIEELDSGDKLAVFGGKRAREALAKIKETNK